MPSVVAGATPIQSVGFVGHPEVSVNLLETKGARAQHSISCGDLEQDLREIHGLLTLQPVTTPPFFSVREDLLPRRERVS